MPREVGGVDSDRRVERRVVRSMSASRESFEETAFDFVTRFENVFCLWGTRASYIHTTWNAIAIFDT